MLYFINSKHLFFTVLEAGLSKIKTPVDLVSPEVHFLDLKCQLFTMSSLGRRGRVSLWTLLLLLLLLLLSRFSRVRLCATP